MRVLALLCLTCCDKFEYNPYQRSVNSTSGLLNQANIDRIKKKEPFDDDTVNILFTGDSQRFYRSLDALVAKANSLDEIDFVILAGDITDFGLQREFSWINERLRLLRAPYLCVVGNHDLTAGGPGLYEAIYGPRNFSFSYKGYKFIMHDTNSREYNFNGQVPDIGWLSSQMREPGGRWMVGVSHVPPYSEDFDSALESAYARMLGSDKRFILSLHGHLHSSLDTFYYNDHVRYITTYSVDKNRCLLLRMINGQIEKELIFY